MSLSDPTLVGSLIGVGGSLVGVLVGGWAARRQYRSEYVFRKRNALRAAMIELIWNQSSLSLDLDRILPAWLVRAHLVSPSGVAEIKRLLADARGFRSQVYEALFPELIATEFGSELMSYYRGIAWLNHHTPPDERLDIARYFDSYVRELASAIRRADDLVRAIDKEIRKSWIRPWGKNRDMDSFVDGRETNLFRAHLASHDLFAVQAFLTDGKKPPAFDKILESHPERLESYRHAAEKF